MHSSSSGSGSCIVVSLYRFLVVARCVGGKLLHWSRWNDASIVLPLWIFSQKIETNLWIVRVCVVVHCSNLWNVQTIYHLSSKSHLMITILLLPLSCGQTIPSHEERSIKSAIQQIIKSKVLIDDSSSEVWERWISAVRVWTISWI